MSGDDRVRRLYAAYQDWRAGVYDELDRLSVEELDTLGRRLRGDTGQLLDRIDAALARLASERGRDMNDNDTTNTPAKTPIKVGLRVPTGGTVNVKEPGTMIPDLLEQPEPREIVTYDPKVDLSSLRLDRRRV